MMRHPVLVTVLVLVSVQFNQVQCALSYPGLVSWERTDSETFVSRPNILEDIDYIHPSVVSANAERREEHFYTDRGLPEGKLECLRTTTRRQPQLKFVRKDLPGVFACEKYIFVIPVIQVEVDRFFNVSLDFLRLESSSPVRVPRFSNLTGGLKVEVGPSGIVFVSGVFRSGKGTLCLKLDLKNSLSKTLYKLKVLFNIGENERKGNQRKIEFKMAPNRKDVERSEIEEQIEAIKCASQAVSLRPWDFHSLNPEHEFIENFSLRAYSEFPEDFCAPDPKRSETSASCQDFSISEIIFDNPKCQSATNKRSEEKVLVVTEKESSVGSAENSEENYMNDTNLGDVAILNNEIVSASSPSTTTTTTPTPSATKATTTKAITEATMAMTERTRPSGKTEVAKQGSVLANGPESDESPDSDPNTMDRGSSGDSGVRLEAIPPAVLQNEVSDRDVDDPRLRVAMYGMLALASGVVFVIFLFLFSRLDLCKKKTGYDPVHMARLSDDNNTKFA